jgi:hypothetical protein
MPDGVPTTPQSRRRHTSRLGRELDDCESQHRVPVCNSSHTRKQLTNTPQAFCPLTPHPTPRVSQSGGSQQVPRASTNRSEGQ